MHFVGRARMGQRCRRVLFARAAHSAARRPVARTCTQAMARHRLSCSRTAVLAGLALAMVAGTDAFFFGVPLVSPFCACMRVADCVRTNTGGGDCLHAFASLAANASQLQRT